MTDKPKTRVRFYRIRNRLKDKLGGGSPGDTFGYPLITTFAASLYEFTAPKAVIGDNQIEIIKAHIDSMSAVIKGRVKGSGGTLGAELAANLSQAIAKYETV